MNVKPANWTHKIKRYSIKGKWYWYETMDGGYSWSRISTAKAMEIIDAMHGVAIN